MRFVAALLAISVVTMISACGGSGSDSGSNDQSSAPPSPPPAATITISGIVSDGRVSGASVVVRKPDGETLCSATADAEGRFACDAVETGLEQGFIVEASGGEIGDSPLVGELKAVYGLSEATDSANVTVMTTLISELVDREGSGTLIDQRDTVIAELANIGLFAKDDWNVGDPADVDVAALRAEVALNGVSPVVKEIAADVSDGELAAENMFYFPAAHGGIKYLSLNAPNNVVSGFAGGLVSADVTLIGLDENSGYEFSILAGPGGIEIDAEGVLSYAIPDSATDSSDMSFELKVLNASTGKGRRISGSIFVIAPETFSMGTVGPEGGTLREPVNSVEIVIPKGSVEAEVDLSLLRGQDAGGNLALQVSSTGEIDEFAIYLPDPEQINHAVANDPETTSTQRQEKGGPIVAGVEARAVAYPYTPWAQTLDWFYEGRRIGQQMIVYKRDIDEALAISGRNTGSLLSLEVASALYCPESLNSTQSKGKIPVLFIHGYKRRDLIKGFELGGGDKTWGDFLPRVGELVPDPETYPDTQGFFPCEFRWKSNARFQVLAEDLRKAIDVLAQKTGTEVHLVAHSFGGILARTYLQGLAESPIVDYGRFAASLTTLGTPHSGIADAPSKEMHGVTFPDGQDGDWKFDTPVANQLSSYQMGEYLGRPSGLSAREKQAYGLADTEGFIAASINATSDDDSGTVGFHPFPDEFPVQVLIGVNAYPKKIEMDGLATTGGYEYIAEDGDGLITYEGQRFHPALVADPIPTALLTPEATKGSPVGPLNARVTEYILGASEFVRAEQVVSGEVVAFSPPLGFSHTESWFSGSRPKRFPEVRVDCESLGNDATQTGCDSHDGFRRVKTWLQGTAAKGVNDAYKDPDDTSTSSVNIGVSDIDVTGGASNIRMFATVVTQNGVPIEKLRAGNFSLSEFSDGETREVAINSVTLKASSGTAVVIAIDRSGSMGPSYNNDIVAAKEAASNFVQNMKPGDQAAVIDFAGDVAVRQEFTRDKELLRSAIESVEVGAFTGTAAYDAAYEGLVLTEEVFGRKAVLLLTDGADLSSRRSIAEVTDYATSLGVPIYTIGLGVDPGSPEEAALVQLADDSNAGANGSGYYAAPSAADLQELYRVISDLLSSAYEIGWESSGAPGDNVTVVISVQYETALGVFTDSFSTSYTVP